VLVCCDTSARSCKVSFTLRQNTNPRRPTCSACYTCQETGAAHVQRPQSCTQVLACVHLPYYRQGRQGSRHQVIRDTSNADSPICGV
jgi:hypothetical protein